jgi:glycosyltransferase involved in cell wall biosynthesis
VTKPAKRIVFVATDLSTGGGVNRVIRDLSGLFAGRLGYDVTVMAARSDAAPSYAFAPSVHADLRGPGGILHYIRQLWQLRKSRPDWVIGSWTQDNILLIALFMLSATRVVVVEHSSWDFHAPFIRLLRRLFYPAAAKVVVLNPADRVHYERVLTNVSLIPNPVSLPAIVPAPREKLFLSVGHLSPVKNFKDAIRAMAASRLEAEGWALTLIGSGAEDAALHELARSEGLKRFSIERTVTNLADWYVRASILLVPSQTEVFSLVLGEAMAAGVVPIAYATDGPRYLLEDFPDLLVARGDVRSLARRMTAVAHMGDLNPLRLQLRQSVERRFSPNLIAEQWCRLLS